MKVLKIINPIHLNTLKEGLTNYEFGDFESELKTILGFEKIVIAKIKLDVDSRLTQYNINLINDSLVGDEESIDYILDNYFEVDEEKGMPGLNYKHFLSYGLEYSTKMEDGHVVRKVKKSEELDKAVTEYYITIWPDINVDNSDDLIIVLEPVASYAGKLIFDYETISNYIPDFTNKLIELGYAKVIEDGYEIDEELQSIIDYING